MSVLFVPDFTKLASQRGNSCLREKGELAKQIPHVLPAAEWDDAVYRADLEDCVGGWSECARLAACLVEGTRYSDATDEDDVKAALRLHRHYNSEYFYENECDEEDLAKCLCCNMLTDLWFQLMAVDPVGAYRYGEDLLNRTYEEMG